MVNSLKNKAASGAKWSVIDNLANSGITFLVGLLLARLLSPEEFGVIGIILVFIAIAQTIIEGGLSNALIRKLEVTQIEYNTVFYSNLVISIFLMVLTCFISKPLAVFFQIPILADIMPIMSITLVIGALSIVQRTYFIRKIDFKTQAYISLIASIGSGIIGIALALLNYGVWSLVAQQLSRQVLITLFFWFFSNWRPSRTFSKKSFNELFDFAYKILLSNLINSVYKNGFTFVIGKFYSAVQLGHYTRADQFNTIFTNNLTGVIQKVSFPVLSSIQDDKERLIFNFRKISIYSCIITFPLVLGMGAAAEPLIIILIGEKWRSAILLLQIMCSFGILYPVTAINLNMLNVEGRSDYILKMEIIKKLLFIPLFFIGFYHNIIILLISLSVYYYIELYFNTFYSEKLFGYGLWKQIKDLTPVFLISLAISFIIWLVTQLEITYIQMAIIQILIFCLGYPLLFKLFHIIEFNELIQIFSKQIKKT